MRKLVLFALFLAGGVLINLGGNLPQALAAGKGNAWDTAVALMTKTFGVFAPGVKTSNDGQYFSVESNGMPNHPLMIGITNWIAQVPVPQDYTGSNAWKIPLVPVEAKTPLSVKTGFYRGAIAVAADGIPIFNPIAADGVNDTYLTGQLDQWGGHSGRADDYHYHIAPLFLQSQLPPGSPLAWALDGYPIYGLTEVDGSVPQGLDAFHGHKDAQGNYHYHASKTYPYINGGFHGEVTERNGQVEPQPGTQPIRGTLQPLHGGVVTGFQVNGTNDYTLTYTMNGGTGSIRYALADGKWTFTFTSVKGEKIVEVHTPGEAGKDSPAGAPGGGAPPPPPNKRP